MLKFRRAASEAVSCIASVVLSGSDISNSLRPMGMSIAEPKVFR